MQKHEHRIRQLSLCCRFFGWALLLFFITASTGLLSVFGFNFAVVGISSTDPFMLFAEFVYVDESTGQVGSKRLYDSNNMVSYLWYALTITSMLSFCWIIFNLDRLFNDYSKGAVFTPFNSRRLTQIGALMIGMFILDSCAYVLLETILTNEGILPPFADMTYPPLENIPGEVILNMSELEGGFEEFSSPPESQRLIETNMTLLICGIFTTVIARVMAYAEQLKEEVDTLV
jgi:hypothetical protein